ncbi:MAG TPA: type II toxin-antitoxin system ParD family antitoxin [Bacteroidia bacterium]|nr:type II toxin-antitoxin system ParD family antitoxin [Bacteroidia bacterium]
MEIQVNLHFSHFIDDEIKRSNYNTAEDVVQAGLALLEEKKSTYGRTRTSLA